MAEMTEREAFGHVLEGFGRARDGLRAMAQLRKDMRWQETAILLGQIEEKVKILAQRPGVHIFKAN